jgi:NADH dehydrogenase
VRVTLIDRNNYHQFQPLLYQVATSQLAPSDVAFSCASCRDDENDVVTIAEVADDRRSRRVSVTTTHASASRRRARGWAAPASQPELLPHPRRRGATVPDLYSPDTRKAAASRNLAVFEEADRDPSLINAGALNFRRRGRRADRRGARRRARGP